MHDGDMEALDKFLGNPKATQQFDKRQLLELELRAIEFWDANYYADPKRDVNDTGAFSARQARKKKILEDIGPQESISRSRRQASSNSQKALGNEFCGR